MSYNAAQSDYVGDHVARNFVTLTTEYFTRVVRLRCELCSSCNTYLKGFTSPADAETKMTRFNTSCLRRGCVRIDPMTNRPRTVGDIQTAVRQAVNNPGPPAVNNPGPPAVNNPGPPTAQFTAAVAAALAAALAKRDAEVTATATVLGALRTFLQTLDPNGTDAHATLLRVTAATVLKDDPTSLVIIGGDPVITTDIGDAAAADAVLDLVCGGHDVAEFDNLVAFAKAIHEGVVRGGNRSPGQPGSPARQRSDRRRRACRGDPTMIVAVDTRGSCSTRLALADREQTHAGGHPGRSPR